MLTINYLPIPIEKVQLSSELNGATGVNRNRDGGLLINADNDLQAIHSWLADFEDSPATYRNYRKEIERLLMWSLLVKQKPFSSLAKDDIKEYELFLRCPSPSEIWCGPRKPRHHPEWKPFEGPLSEVSVQQAITCIGAAMGYMSDAGYLKGNPVKLLRRRNIKASSEHKVERYLDLATWQYLWQFISELPEDSERQKEHKIRNEFLFSLLYLLGPRVQEVANICMNSFVLFRNRWWCEILGKGNKLERIPVNNDMLNALIHYRRTLGLPDFPHGDEDSPLIRDIKGVNGISSNMVYRIVKQVLADAAMKADTTDPTIAKQLSSASTHWFRHTSITHQADSGVDIRHLKKSARHNDINTTARYMHAEDEKWHDDIEKHHL